MYDLTKLTTTEKLKLLNELRGHILKEMRDGITEFDGVYVYNAITIPVGEDKYSLTDDLSVQTGTIWVEDDKLHLIDEDGTEQSGLNDADVDETPVDGATDSVISSDWAYDHENGSNPHPIVCNNDEVVVNNGQVVYNV